MSSGRRQDDSDSDPRPAEPGADESDDLLTSDDLFGDMVDAPAEESHPHAASRRAPIKIQVTEPGKERLPGSREPLSDDMVSLLDNLLGGEEPSPPQPGPAEPSGRPMEPAGPRADAGGDDSRPAPRRPGPAPSAHDQADSLLRSLVPEQAAVPRPTSRTSTKFSAAPSRPEPEAGGGGLDLAGLAESAFGEATPAPSPAPPRAHKPSQPDTYGPYRLIERVARGGMAEVFKAKRTGPEGFEKVVAVKRILPHLSDNQEFVDMFVNEAKMVAGLTHPNIVQIFDLGRIENSYFLAMEFVQGRDLRSIQKRAVERNLRIPFDLSALVISKVCLALEYAHRKKDERGHALRIVHRDISPQNILLSFEGEVKLTDFGIAKAAAKASTTDGGALRGKLLYMSPEQAWGRPLDRRADLFSLGVVFYELLTGQKPFVQAEGQSLLDMVRECRLTPARQANPRVPEELDAIVTRSLDPDPEHRFHTAAEMHKDIDRVLHERQAPTAAELSRFLELIFDQEERGDPTPDGAEPWVSTTRLEIDLDTNPTNPSQTTDPTNPVGEQPESERTAPGVPRDPKEVSRLLDRLRGK